MDFSLCPHRRLMIIFTTTIGVHGSSEIASSAVVGEVFSDCQRSVSMLTDSKWGGWVKHLKSNPSPLPSFTRLLGNCWMALVSMSMTLSRWCLCKGVMDLSLAMGIPTGNAYTEVMKSVKGLRQKRSPLIVFGQKFVSRVELSARVGYMSFWFILK